jgi:hypothetical protein
MTFSCAIVIENDSCIVNFYLSVWPRERHSLREFAGKFVIRSIVVT